MKEHIFHISYIASSAVSSFLCLTLLGNKFYLFNLISAIIVPSVIIRLMKPIKEKNNTTKAKNGFKEYIASSLIDIGCFTLAFFLYAVLIHVTNIKFFFELFLIFLISLFLGRNIVFTSLGCLFTKIQYKPKKIILLKNFIYLIEITLAIQSFWFFKIIGCLVFILDIITYFLRKKSFLDNILGLEIKI